MSNGAPPQSDTSAGVLICDDNEAMRALLAEIVGSSRVLRVVGEAVDGNEAIVEAIRLQPSVILLDLAMPNRSGLDALPELRKRAPGAQIIVFSGFADDAVGEKVIELGAASYLEKGARPDTIVAAIERVLLKTPGLPASPAPHA